MWLPENVLVRAPSESEAIELLTCLEKVGVRWPSGDPLTDHSNWSDYRWNTCYRIQGNVLTYGDMTFYKSEQGEKYVPKDPECAFCSVQYALELCGYERCPDIDYASLESLL